MLARPGRLERLLVADIDPGRTVRRLGALLGTVDFANFERVDLQGMRQLIDTAFDRERADRRPGRTVGGDLRAIAQHVVADRFGVWQVVNRQAADAALLHRRARKRAGLVFTYGPRGGDLPILLGAKLDLDHRA